MYRKRAFTLVELLVVVAIIAVLAGMLAPSLRRVGVVARRAACSSNLHQYGIAVRTYLASNAQIFPSCHSGGAVTVENTWIGAIAPFAPSKELAHCPALGETQTDYGLTWKWEFSGAHLGYGYNMWFLGGSHQANRQGEGSMDGIRMYRDTKLGSVKSPGMCLMFADSNPKTENGQDYGCAISLFWPLVNRYHEGVNGSRHDNAASLCFVDGHAEIREDPDQTINPPYDYSPFFIEEWDHLQRRYLWPR